MFPCRTMLWWSSLCTNKRINSSDASAEVRRKRKVLLEKEEEEDQNRVRKWRENRKEKELRGEAGHLSWDTHPGLAPPRAALLDNAAFQLFNLPGFHFFCSFRSNLTFYYFRVIRNTSLLAMIKCECSNLGRGGGTGQSGKKLILTYFILLSPSPPPESYLI